MIKFNSIELIKLGPILNDYQLHLDQCLEIYKHKELQKLTKIIFKIYKNLNDDGKSYMKSSVFYNGMPCYSDQCAGKDAFAEISKGVSADDEKYLREWFSGPTARCNRCGFRIAIGVGQIWNMGCLFSRMFGQKMEYNKMIQLADDYQNIMRRKANA